MTDTPPPGTTRYLCPVGCGWHHDRPPLPSTAGITPEPAARGLSEAVSSIASQALQRDMQEAESALREHLATHTTEQFVRTINDLRTEVAALQRRVDEGCPA